MTTPVSEERIQAMMIAGIALMTREMSSTRPGHTEEDSPDVLLAVGPDGEQHVGQRRRDKPTQAVEGEDEGSGPLLLAL